MSKLWLKLTPFSSDSSGFLSVLYGLDALVLSFDPQGCTNNYKNIDEPRWKDKKQRFKSARITQRELILGKEHILIEQVVKYIEEERPNFFVLMGGPISYIIGSDIIALAKEVERITNIRSIGIDFKGQGFYDEGASQAMLTLAKEFLRPSKITIKKSVNILGATIYEFPSISEYEDLLEMISEDYRILTTWGISSSFDKIKEASRAELNLVLSLSGLPLARYMEEIFAIPYKIFTPIAGIKEGKHKSLSSRNLDKKVLIIGEQLMANGLREYLKNRMGFNHINVASFFMMEKALMKIGDESLSSEGDLERLLSKGGYHILIGDPLFERFNSENNKTGFIGLPHLAVSGQFFLAQRINPYANEIGSFLEKQLKEIDIL